MTRSATITNVATQTATSVSGQSTIGRAMRQMHSGIWQSLTTKVIGKHEVLEVRNVDGRLHVARKARRPDEWDPRDPYGPGAIVTRNAPSAPVRYSPRTRYRCSSHMSFALPWRKSSETGYRKFEQ